METLCGDGVVHPGSGGVDSRGRDAAGCTSSRSSMRRAILVACCATAQSHHMRAVDAVEHRALATSGAHEVRGVSS